MYEKTQELLRLFTNIMLRSGVKLSPSEFDEWKKATLIEIGKACPHCGSEFMPCYCQNDE